MIENRRYKVRENIITRFFKSSLGRGSIILLVMINFANLLNYFFHFSMARLLDQSSFGVLGVLMTLVYVYVLPAEAIQGVFSKYVLKCKSKSNVRYLINFALKKLFVYGLILTVLLQAFSLFLSYYLSINYWYLFLLNLVVIPFFLSAGLRGIMQGIKKFYALGWSNISDPAGKLVMAVLLVILFGSLFGSIIGVVFGSVVGAVFSLAVLVRMFREEPHRVELPGMRSYGKVFLGAYLAIVLAYGLDVILAKRFFPSQIVGEYVAISLIAKMIFLGTTPLGKALFPFSAENHKNSKDSIKLLLKSGVLLVSICFVVVIIFAFIPNQLVSILFGDRYVELAGYLFLLGIATSFLSLANLVITYGLSVNLLEKSYFLLYFFVILEGILLFAGQGSIGSFIMMFVISSVALFVASLFLVGLPRNK